MSEPAETLALSQFAYEAALRGPSVTLAMLHLWAAPASRPVADP
jgi:hypothetical protein